MLNNQEIIQLSTELEYSGCKTIDQFIFRKFGFDYWQLPFYNGLKSALEAMMVLVVIQHPAGYTMYEWQDR